MDGLLSILCACVAGGETNVVCLKRFSLPEEYLGFWKKANKKLPPPHKTKPKKTGEDVRLRETKELTRGRASERGVEYKSTSRAPRNSVR